MTNDQFTFKLAAWVEIDLVADSIRPVSLTYISYQNVQHSFFLKLNKELQGMNRHNTNSKQQKHPIETR